MAAVLNRDIHSRFLVTKDDTGPKLTEINGKLARMDDLSEQAGAGMDQMSKKGAQAAERQRKATIAQYAKLQDYGTQLKKIFEYEQTLTAARKAGIVNVEEYTKRLEQMKLQLAETMAIEERLALSRERRVTGRGSGVTAGVPSTGGGQTKSLFESINQSGKTLIGTINKLSFSIFVLTFGTQQLGEIFLRTFVQVGERVEQQRNRIDLLTKSTETFGKVVTTATDLGLKLDNFAGTFSRFALANEQMGLANDELVKMTKTIAQLGIIGGGTVQEISSAMQQLGQGLASGTLAGDELKSVMENMPYLAVKLAEALEVPVEALREMGAEGELVPALLSGAFQEMAEDVDRIFRNLPVTSEQGLNKISNQWDLMINTILNSVGVDTVGEMFSDWAKGMEEFNTSLEGSPDRVEALVDAFANLAKRLAQVAAGWFALKLIAGVIASFKSASAALKAYTVAAAAAQAATAGVASGMITAQAAAGAMAAKTAAAGVAVKALAVALGPVSLVLGSIAYVAYEYLDAMDDVEQNAKDATAAVTAMGDAFEDLPRRGQEALYRTIEKDLAQITRELEDLQEQTDDTEVGLRDMAAAWDLVSEEMTYYEGLARAVTDRTDAAQNKMTEAELRAKALKEQLDAMRAAMAEVADETKRATGGFGELGEAMDKLRDDAKDSADELRRVRAEFKLVDQYGEKLGVSMAKQSELRLKHAEDMVRVVGTFRSKESTPERAGMLQEYVRRRDKRLQDDIDLIGAEEVRSDQRAASRVSTRAVTDSTKAQTDALKAQAAATKALVSDMKSQISAQQKLIDDSDAYVKTLDAITDRAVELGLPGLEARSEGEARVAAEERDRAIAEKERRVGELAALGDKVAVKKIRMDEEDTARAKKRTAEAEAMQAELEERQQQLSEIASLASEINSVMSTAFTDMADGAADFDDMLKRILVSIRDMIIQLTILKPLSEFLAGSIKGFMGDAEKGPSSAVEAGESLGREIAASVIGSAIKGILPFADGDAVGGTGLGHGVYSSPTTFPMSAPGVHAFASGIGLLGEKDPEAILPLARGKNGKLGVTSNGGGMALNVVVNTLPGQSANVTQQDDNTLTIDIIEQQLAAKVLRGGSALPRSMESAYRTRRT